MDALVGAFTEALPELPLWRCSYAYALADAGHQDAAIGVIDTLLEAGLDRLPRDPTWIPACAALAESVSLLGYAPLAEALAPLLEPHCDQAIVVNVFGAGGYYGGPLTHHLGIIHAALDQWQEAEEDFRASITTNEADGAGPLAARSRFSWASALIRNDRELELATSLLADVRDAADMYGLPGLASRAQMPAR